MAVGDELGTFTANGYEGQSLLICPPLDLIVVRLGKSPDDTHDPELRAWRARMVEAFRRGRRRQGPEGPLRSSRAGDTTWSRPGAVL